MLEHTTGCKQQVQQPYLMISHNSGLELLKRSPTPELLQAALDVDDHSGWWEIIRKMVPQGFEL